jgi:hypothetical protein
MRSSGHNVPLLIVVALLLTVLYPALFLGYRVAPEASLKSEAPWRAQWGPYPNPSTVAVEAATHLGPRLAAIARDGLRVALWDPWIGGGRPGWLSSAPEGRAPLPLAAALVARHGWTWTALVALEIVLSFAGSWWVIRALGAASWPAAIGATAYALSGPVAGHWLDWQGSALALGPLVLLPALAGRPATSARRIAAWTGALLLVLAGGPPAAPFVALAAATTIFSRALLGKPTRWAMPLAATAIALAIAIPSFWLQRAGREPGAPAPRAQAGAAVEGFAALVAPPPRAKVTATNPQPAVAYLGPIALILATLGGVTLKGPARGFWLGTLAVCAAVAYASPGLLLRLGSPQRPLGVLALVVAVLAAHGASIPCRKAAPGGLENVVGAAIWLLLVISLLPPAARRLPFATPDDSELASPIDPGPVTSTTRMVAVLGMLPPDVSATLGLADVRAASFEGEPRYAAQLGAGRGGELTVSRTLDRRTARLGARWVFEPLPLRVVSGELFARVEVADLSLDEQKSLDGLRRARVAVPPGACRLGLPAASELSNVWIERPGHRSQLDPDAALAPESDAWRWFALPPGWPPGGSTVAVAGAAPASAARSVAWDTSGLRLVSEEHGTRLWEWDRARPLAFLAAGLQREGGPGSDEDRAVTVPAERLAALRPLAAGGGGRLQVAGTSPALVDLGVATSAPALVVVQVKYRPALWRATVDANPVSIERVDSVWTGIAVPAGVSHVVLRARLPLSVWLLACGGVLALSALTFPWRRR